MFASVKRSAATLSRVAFKLFKSCLILRKYKKEAQGFLFIFGPSCFIGFKQKVSNTNGFLREDLCLK